MLTSFLQNTQNLHPDFLNKSKFLSTQFFFHYREEIKSLDVGSGSWGGIFKAVEPTLSRPANATLLLNRIVLHCRA